VFIDDDGQAYLYWGNPNCYYVKLNEDMISYSGSIVKLPKLQTYQEGPWIHKRNNNYYLSWSSTCCPEGIGYAMSNSPTGPWTFKGSIMDGNPNSSGNQPGIFDYKGKSYTFGFNYAINFSQTTVHRERRSVCLAELTYNPDGTIPKLPWFGGKLPEPGVPQVGTFNPYDTAQAETICFEKGVRTEACKDVGSGMNVDSIHNGDYIKVKVVDFGVNGAKSFDARVASATNGGTIELHIDSLTGPLVGSIAVTGTGGWQTWATKSCTITKVTGVHDLYFKFTGRSGLLFNFNWWKFYPVDQTGVETGFKNASGCKRNIKITSNTGKALTIQLNLPRSALRTNLTFSLFSLTGRLISTLSTVNTGNRELVMNTTGTRSGTYVLKVLSGNKTVMTKTINLQ
jgi:hypothetical protein